LMCILLKHASERELLDCALAIVRCWWPDRDMRWVCGLGLFDVQEARARRVGRAQAQEDVE
jgi:hypothetical protein